MEQSTGSSTSQRGALTRPIGRHWFQGIVIPGIMLSNRNLQAEWFSRVDIEAKSGQGVVEGEVLVKNGALPHTFPGGDPVLKQFFVTVVVKTKGGEIVDQYEERFGKTFEELIRGPIPRPFINGGTTRHVPWRPCKTGVMPTANLFGRFAYRDVYNRLCIHSNPMNPLRCAHSSAPHPDELLFQARIFG